jgi:hypothetical protein
LAMLYASGWTMLCRPWWLPRRHSMYAKSGVNLNPLLIVIGPHGCKMYTMAEERRVLATHLGESSDPLEAAGSGCSS